MRTTVLLSVAVGSLLLNATTVRATDVIGLNPYTMQPDTARVGSTVSGVYMNGEIGLLNRVMMVVNGDVWLDHSTLLGTGTLVIHDAIPQWAPFMVVYSGSFQQKIRTSPKLSR